MRVPKTIVFLWILGAAVGVTGSWARSRTAVVVVVESDLLAPDELASVRAVVGDGGCGDGTCTHDFVTATPAALPFSFVVEPRGGDPSARFTLVVTGRDSAGASVVERHVGGGFSSGRTILLRVPLERLCRGIACTPTDTCVFGSCVSRMIAPSTLPDVVPGHELEGLRDGGAPIDAPDLDAPPFDANLLPPGACAELPATSPSGVTTIDPDGPGGADPFDAWCENDADGGGWTLIAKVDPASTALAYGSSRWSAVAPMPLGTADTSLGDALLMPYWTVPIEELRIESSSGAFVMEGVPRRRATLRSGMDAPAGGLLDATVADWATVVPGVTTIATPGCVRSGLALSLPEVGPEIRVRIGLIGGPSVGCGDPAFWYGVGASVTGTRPMCSPTRNTAGGGRVCGPSGLRGQIDTFLLVYGR